MCWHTLQLFRCSLLVIIVILIYTEVPHSKMMRFSTLQKIKQLLSTNMQWTVNRSFHTGKSSQQFSAGFVGSRPSKERFHSAVLLSVIGCAHTLHWMYYNDESGWKIRADEGLPVPDLESLKSSVEEGKKMTWEKLAKISTTSVNSSVSSLVEITVSECLENEELYQKYMEALIELLTAYIKALGTPAEDELWSSVMFIKGYLAEIKEKRRQLELLWNNCKALSEHAGQAAFLTGAEFSGCRLGEVMSAAEINMSRLNALNSKLEIELASLEADEIRSSVKHQEEMRDKLRQKQKKELESESDDDDSLRHVTE